MATAAGPLASTAQYFSAKLAVKFAGANLADVEGYTVPISYVGPQGTMAAVTRNIAATAALAGTSVIVPISGTYSVAAIDPITIGNYTYSATAGTASAVYASAATEITINVSRAALPAAATGLAYTSAAGNSEANFIGM